MPSEFVQALHINHFKKKMLLPFSFRYMNIHTFDEDLVSVRFSKHEYIKKGWGGQKGHCLVMIVSILGILAEFMWVVVLYKGFVPKKIQQQHIHTDV